MVCPIPRRQPTLEVEGAGEAAYEVSLGGDLSAACENVVGVEGGAGHGTIDVGVAVVVWVPVWLGVLVRVWVSVGIGVPVVV